MGPSLSPSGSLMPFSSEIPPIAEGQELGKKRGFLPAPKAEHRPI